MPSLLNGHADAAADLYATALLDGPMLMHPPASNEKSDLIDQAYSEYRNLCAAGVEVDPDAFCARFPAYQTSLRRLLEVHREIEADPSLLKKLDRWPAPGDDFCRFRLGQELGRGAFARVFLAREPAVGNRQVVLKVSLHSDDEIDTLGKFEHPNVVPILYAPETDKETGFTVVCMPYLGKTTLLPVIEEVSKRKKVPDRGDFLLTAAKDERRSAENTTAPARAIRRGSFQDAVIHVGERLASALAYVHERGILHRDLKPSNVLLCPNGEPVLIDFNLAHDRSLAEYRLGGTLPYMPPEQLDALTRHRRGEPAPSDNRGDIYALGVLLYELLAGAHPFGPVPLKLKANGARQFLLERQRKGPRPLRAHNRSVDPALEALILQCLSHDPGARPATAREMAKELRRLQAPIRRARRWAAAHVRFLAIAGALLLTCTAGTAGYVASLPSSDVVHKQRGELLYREGKYEEAIKEFTASLGDKKDQPDVHYERGRAFLKNGQADQAVEDFREANPDTEGRVAASLAYALSRRHDYAQGLVYAEKAIRADYKGAAMQNDLSYLYHYRGKNSESETAATDALVADPHLRAAYYNRAVARHALWMTNGDPAHALAALEDIQEVINRGGTTANSYFLAATIAAGVLNDKYQLNQAAGPQLNAQLALAAGDALYLDGGNYLQLAVQCGYPSKNLEMSFTRMKCRAEWARQLPSDMKVQATGKGMDENLRLVDPVND
jgi:serine/threonine protein kinase